MTSFISESIEIQSSPADVFGFLKDFRKLESIMPEQIENWQANEGNCSFLIKNIGLLGMKKGTEHFPSRFEFESSEISKVRFKLVFQMKEIENDRFNATFEIRTELNPMVEMLARRPLTNFVSLLALNLKRELEHKPGYN